MNNKTNKNCFACHKSLTEKVEQKNEVKKQKASIDNNTIDLIKQLAELHTQGILTDEEFSTKKAQLLEKIDQDPLFDEQTDESIPLKQTIDDSDWIDDGNGFVRCPTCNKSMSLDYINAKRVCPDCGREYTQEHVFS